MSIKHFLLHIFEIHVFDFGTIDGWAKLNILDHSFQLVMPLWSMILDLNSSRTKQTNWRQVFDWHSSIRKSISRQTYLWLAIDLETIPQKNMNECICISFVISKRNILYTQYTVENDVQCTDSSEEMSSFYLPIGKSYYFNENDSDDWTNPVLKHNHISLFLRYWWTQINFTS